ncbi:MAG: OmpA family protein [Alphaproteobacteria bacterium]|nr:OmpA family protein [Alphaproteobacteria bacterium]
MSRGNSEAVIESVIPAYGFFRLRARIRRDASLIAEDPVLRSTNALNFAASEAYVAAGIATIITSLFNFFFIDQPLIWDIETGDGVAIVFNQVFATLSTFAVPLSAILSAGFVARAAPSAEALRVLGAREIRRRFLISEGAVGLWPTVLLASALAVATSINSLSAQADVSVANLIGEALEWWIIGALIVTIAIYGLTSFVQTLVLFARSVDASGRYRTQWGTFARGLLALLLVRPVIGALLYALLILLSLALTIGIYAGGIKMREAVGLEDPEAVSEWFEELSYSARGLYRGFNDWVYDTTDLTLPAWEESAAPVTPAPALSVPVEITAYFYYESAKLSSESMAVLDQAVPKAGAAYLIIGHVDTSEAASSADEGAALSLARAQAVRTRLIALGVAEQEMDVRGAGAAEPAVVTGPGIKEPLNRRVQILRNR